MKMKFRLQKLYENLALYFLRKAVPSCNLLSHADRELRIAGYSPESDEGPNKWAYENVTDLIRLFSMQGHSGFSANYVMTVFHKLAMFTPLAPLTGEDGEWIEVSEGLFQNKRAGHIFKRVDGETVDVYNIEGRTFHRKGEDSCFTNYYSKTKVEFPYLVREPECVAFVDCPDCTIKSAAKCITCGGSQMLRADTREKIEALAGGSR